MKMDADSTIVLYEQRKCVHFFQRDSTKQANKTVKAQGVHVTQDNSNLTPDLSRSKVATKLLSLHKSQKDLLPKTIESWRL